MSNVIKFEPKNKSQATDNELDQLDPFYDDGDALEFAILVSFDIVESMTDLGLNIENDPRIFRDILAILETIRGMVHRTKNQPYPWHKITDMVGDFKDEELPELLTEYLQKLVDTRD